MSDCEGEKLLKLAREYASAPAEQVTAAGDALCRQAIRYAEPFVARRYREVGWLRAGGLVQKGAGDV